jgi:hypothetical protein
MASGMQLLLLMGGVVPEPVEVDLIDALQSVSVSTGAGQQGGFQLGFAVSRKSRITRSLLPGGYFDPGRRVIVVAVVAGRRNVLMDGIITRQEMQPSDTPGASMLTVTGLDLSAVLDVVYFEVPWPGVPWVLRVAAICAKYAMYGIVPAPIPSVYTPLPDPQRAIEVQAGTDLAYVNLLASQAGHVFHVEPGPDVGTSIAYWGPAVRFGAEQHALTVNMGPASNVESLSFGYDGLSPTRLTIPITDDHTKVTVRVPAPDVSLLRPPLARRPAVKLRSQPVEPRGPMTMAESLLYGLAKTVEAADAVTGQGKLDVLRYGHVLRARQLVGVRGAGRAYDGLYFVSRVTHEIKRGEYKQSFSLSRDGLEPLRDGVRV